MADLTQRLHQQAEKIARDRGDEEWFNVMRDAAHELERLRAELEAAKILANDGMIPDSIGNVGRLALANGGEQ